MKKTSAEIIQKLQEAQKESGLSYAVLEKMTGISHSSIQRYLTGTSKKFSFEDVTKIARALALDPAEVMGWKDPAEEKADKVVRALATDEARILAFGVDQLPEEDRVKALNMMRVMFAQYADYFQDDKERK